LIYFRQTDKLSVLHACLIALGTVVLLSGVLALSWRLSDEQTQPAVAQSALAPGLGFVEDTDNEDYDDISTPDEEAAISVANERLMNDEPMTPTTKLDTVLGATRNVRKSVRLTEADEIWGELDDDAKDSPSRPLRASTVRSLLGGASQDPLEENDETTSLLRSNTAGRRRRRRSTGFPGFTARPSPRIPRKENIELQRTLGGLFRFGWWRSSRKGPFDPEEGNGRSDGSSPT